MEYDEDDDDEIVMMMAHFPESRDTIQVEDDAGTPSTKMFDEKMVVEDEGADDVGEDCYRPSTTVRSSMLSEDVIDREDDYWLVRKCCNNSTPCYQRTTSLIDKHASFREWFVQWLTPLRALIILFCINTTIYLDRGNIGAVLAPIEQEFDLDSWQTGMVWGAFMVAYMVASPVLARLAKRYTAVKVMSIGILLMSLSAFFTLFSTGFWSLFFARAFIGFGEASYASLSAPYIKTIAPPDRYHTWLGIYFAAMPIGAACGYIMGGVTSTFLDWKVSFLVEFIVLVFAAATCSLFPDASRVCNSLRKPYGVPVFMEEDVSLVIEEEDDQFGTAGINNITPGWYQEYVPSKEQYDGMLSMILALWSNQPYVFVTLGCAALNFVAGAFVFWCPIYIHEVLGASLMVATISVGVLTVCFGIVGALFGGKAVDYITGEVVKDKSGRIHNTIFILDHDTRPPEFEGEDPAYQHFQWMKIVVASRFAILLSVLQIIVMVGVTMVYSYGWFFALFAVAEFLLFALIAPVNALVMDVVDDEHREFAVGMQIFVSHLVGDLPSPIILGLIRQLFDLRAAMYLLTAWFAWVTLWFWNVDHEFRKGPTARKWTIVRIASVAFFGATPYLMLAILVGMLLFFPEWAV